MTTLTDQQVAETRARGERLKQTLPAVMLAGGKAHQRTTRPARRSESDREARDKIEATYNELEGDWRDWLDVARRYERKIPAQDRLDYRHTAMLRLATVHRRTGKAIPLYQAYRIASYCVADYYREQGKLRNSLDCKHCPTAKRRECVQHSLYSQCPKVRPVVSLEAEYIDGAGEAHQILDTLADDNAVDLDAWLDADTWLRGCQTRLVDLAVKVRDGIPLTSTDQRYFNRQRQKELERYQLTMF